MIAATLLLLAQANQPDLMQGMAKLVCTPQKWGSNTDFAGNFAWYSNHQLVGAIQKSAPILIDTNTAIVETLDIQPTGTLEGVVPLYKQWIVVDTWDGKIITRKIVNNKTKKIRSEWKFHSPDQSISASVGDRDNGIREYAFSTDGKSIFEIDYREYSSVEPTLLVAKRSIDNPSQVVHFPPKRVWFMVQPRIVDDMVEYDIGAYDRTFDNPVPSEPTDPLTRGLIPSRSPRGSVDGKTTLVRWNPATPDKETRVNIPTTPTIGLVDRRASEDGKIVMWVFKDFKNGIYRLEIGNTTYTSKRIIGYLHEVKKAPDGTLSLARIDDLMLSPDGKRIAFRYDDSVYVVNI